MVSLRELEKQISSAENQELRIFLVTREDVYETVLGDGYYGHLFAAFWSEADAEECAESQTDVHVPGASQTGYSYAVEPHTLGLRDGQPALLTSTRPHDNTISVTRISKLLR